MLQEVDTLLRQSEGPCLSVILPTHRTQPGKNEDPIQLTKAVKEVEALLRRKFPDSYPELSTKLERKINNIDFKHTKDGLGIYVSPRHSRLIDFEFPVTKKIKVSEHFDDRDLMFSANNIIPYCVLSISKKHIRLFEGMGEELHEVLNDDFPIHYEGSNDTKKQFSGVYLNSFSLNDLETEKPAMEEVRFKEFMRRANFLLIKYLPAKMPLIVSGSKKEVTDYLHLTPFSKNIIGLLKGSYNFSGQLKFADLAWAEVRNYLSNKNRESLEQLKELQGERLLAIGVEEVWKAAKAGNCLELIVEKDFECHSFLSEDGFTLKLHRPDENNTYKFVSDTVEQVIELINEKGGKVMFVENGSMTEFYKIALRLRYSTRGLSEK